MNKNLLLLKVLLEPQRRKVKYTTAISENVFIAKLDDIDNKQNNTLSQNN